MAVRCTTEGPVCTVVLDRPERLNALNDEVRRELLEIVRDLAEDGSVSVVVVRGAGRSFSAGADLRDPVPLPESWTQRRILASRWQRLLDELEALQQVTVAVLHGHVIGGAALLAASCDLRVASDDLAVRIPELELGIPLTWAGLPRLVREIGLPRTRELVMTGRVLGALEAREWGFVHRVAADVSSATQELVDELLRMPAGPLALTKSALAALGRSAMAAAWADADLLAWSITEPQARSSRERYRSDARLDG